MTGRNKILFEHSRKFQSNINSIKGINVLFAPKFLFFDNSTHSLPKMDRGGDEFSSSKWLLTLSAAVLSFDFLSTFYIIPLYWAALGGSLSSYGVVFGVYSFARALASPLTGYAADKFLGIRRTMVFCLSLMVFGNFLFFFASAKTYKIDDAGSEGYGPGGIDFDTSSLDNVSALGRWILIIGRVFAGAGSSAAVLIESYLMQSTPSSLISHPLLLSFAFAFFFLAFLLLFSFLFNSPKENVLLSSPHPQTRWRRCE